MMISLQLPTSWLLLHHVHALLHHVLTLGSMPWPLPIMPIIMPPPK
ncbi:MAG TPA: hypothetical protein VFP00_03945 [Burkholderiales bacterium]|nr:hypothetical protein [Burkholderiales bacterium]